MATFIFSKTGIKPIFVSYDPGYNNFYISEGISENEDKKSWKTEILLKIDDRKQAYNRLRDGISVKSREGIQYLVKLKRVFIIEKLQVFHNDEEIKGNQYIDIQFRVH